jgi:hypothetical protein
LVTQEEDDQMASSSDRSGTSAASRPEGGVALVAIGAVLLLVSLFLHWYQPGHSAWTVFEVWDLVLAALGVVALVAAGGRLGFGRLRPDSWLVAPSVAAFVIVVASLLNHPPAAIGEDPMIGIWLALIATVLMVVGVALSVAGVSVAINIDGLGAHPTPGATPDMSGRGVSGTRGLRLRRRASRTAPPADEAVAPPASAAAGEVQTEATRVLDEDPASRRDPPAPPR